jgi:hypothetical protein
MRAECCGTLSKDAEQMQKLFDVKAVAERYKVAQSTVCGWIAAGVMPATNVAGPKAKRRRWRISDADVAEFENRRGNLQPATAEVGRKGARTVARPVKDYLQNGGV